MKNIGSQSTNTVQEKSLFMILVIVFVMSTLVGYIHSKAIVENINPEELFKNISYQPCSIKTLLLIFSNNVRVAFTTILSGVLVFPPILIVLANGLVIGSLVAYVANKSYVPAYLVAMKLIPHGILEVPAFILSACVGIQLGRVFIKFLSLRRRGQKQNLEKLTGLLTTYFLARLITIILLLTLAAFIETYVSPYIGI